MENPDKKELIDGISSLLKAHEEPYELGSWENFSKQKKSKQPVVLAWLSIAATIAIIATAVPYLLKDQHPQEITAKLKAAPDKESLKSTGESPREEAEFPAAKGGMTVHEVVLAGKSSKSSQARQLVEKNTADNHMATVEDRTTRDTVKTKLADQAPVRSGPVKDNDIMTFLEHETKVAAVKKNKGGSKWNFGVELLPTLLENKVNLGAGITTEFKLSDKFSISSGIAYVALDASKNPNSSPAGMANAPATAGVSSYASNKRLISTDAYISGIDIPLAVTYNLNKKVYTSIGLSYFNVLSERRSNNYVTELQVTSMLKNTETGLTETLQTRLSEENAELSSETALEGNSYLGFFNFSVGHKQQIFKNYNIVIEPFMKIPVGKLSNEDIKLGNGGVKLRFSF